MVAQKSREGIVRTDLYRDRVDLQMQWVAVRRLARLLELEFTVAPIDAGRDALMQAAETCFAHSDVRYLGNLYARTVRFLWPKLTAPQVPAQPAAAI